MRNYSNKFDHTLIKGKINFLLDIPNGSSGKGKLESFLAKNSNYNFVMTSNSANASHTVVDGGQEFIFKALPSSSLYHDKLDAIYIVAGACFELKALLEEIEYCKIPRTKIRISPRAAIIQQIDKDFEKGLCDLDGNYYDTDATRDGTVKTGTTASGSGTVLAKKTVRNKTLVTAKDCPELADMICIVEEEILSRLAAGQSGLYSIGQGFPLSNNYWRFAPHTTARNVTVSAGLNDAFLPPSVTGNVFLNDRTYPIRIASYKFISEEVELVDAFVESPILETEGEIEALFGGYNKELFCIKPKLGEMKEHAGYALYTIAGLHLTKPQIDANPQIPYHKIDSYSGDFFPDQEEITWEQVMDEGDVQIQEKVMLTTLTKLPRRIATYSKLNLSEAIKYNQTDHKVYISMNFMNWIDNQMAGETDSVTQKSRQWIKHNIEDVIADMPNVSLMFIGTGEQTDQFVTLES